MRRAVRIAVLAILPASIAAAQEKVELRYHAEGELQLLTQADGTAEGHIWGTAPGMENLSFLTKEKRTLASKLEAPSGDTADMKVAGEVTVEGTFNGVTRDPQTEPLGPLVFTFDERGQLVRTEAGPFEATAQNLVRFRWWRYIVQQLDLPPVLPEEAVAPGDTWDSELNLAGPDRKPLKAKASFRLLGVGSESEGQTAWIRSEVVLPLALRFKGDEGEYNVDGKVRLDRVYAFDIDKGLPRGSRDFVVVDMAVTAKRAGGEEFRLQLFFHGAGKTLMKVKTPGDEEPKKE